MTIQSSIVLFGIVGLGLLLLCAAAFFLTMQKVRLNGSSIDHGFHWLSVRMDEGNNEPSMGHRTMRVSGDRPPNPKSEAKPETSARRAANG